MDFDCGGATWSAREAAYLAVGARGLVKVEVDAERGDGEEGDGGEGESADHDECIRDVKQWAWYATSHCHLFLSVELMYEAQLKTLAQNEINYIMM